MTAPMLLPTGSRLGNKTPAWVFDVATGQYQSTTTGRTLKPDELRVAVEVVLMGAKAEARELVLRLEAREDSIKRVVDSMGALLVSVHMVVAAAGTAGVPGLLDEAEADLRATIAREKAYVTSFGADLMQHMALAGGAVLVALALAQNQAAWIARAQSYMGAALVAFERHRHRLMVFLGYKEARRVVHRLVEHCPGCIREAGKGWVAIENLKLLGFEECEQWCYCTVEYRKPIVQERGV